MSVDPVENARALLRGVDLARETGSGPGVGWRKYDRDILERLLAAVDEARAERQSTLDALHIDNPNEIVPQIEALRQAANGTWNDLLANAQAVAEWLLAEQLWQVRIVKDELEIVNDWLVQRGVNEPEYPLAGYGALPYSDAEPLVHLSDVPGWDRMVDELTIKLKAGQVREVVGEMLEQLVSGPERRDVERIAAILAAAEGSGQ